MNEMTKYIPIMQLLCLYPPEKPTILFKVCSIIVYVFFSLPIPVLSILYFVLEENIPVERFGDNGFMVAQMIACVFKFMPFIINGERIKKCINYFENLPSFSMTTKQKMIIDKSTKMSLRISKTFLLFISGVLIMANVRPLFLTGNRFPVDVWLPVNSANDIKFYYAVYLYVSLVFGYMGFACAVVDPLIGGLASLASAHIEVINDRLENLDKYAEKKLNIYKLNNHVYNSTDKSILKIKIVYDEIRKCISHHNMILHFIKEYEVCFSPVVFSQFMGSCLVLCFCCFQLKLLNLLSLSALISVLGFSGVLTIIYFYCHYGTKIHEASDNLPNAIYLSNWYDYDIKSKKALIILMERSQKPITITAGKIMDVSLETFATILRRSYSLFAFLQNQ